jgi:alanine dehydrogenase
MRVGIVRELSPGESRVALTPNAVYEIVKAGHVALVELGAGREAGISDEDYSAAGGHIVGDAGEVWECSDLVVKVSGPVPEEYGYLREDMILFGFLSLAVNPGLVRALVESRCLAFAMETVYDARNRLPALAPMSEIAGLLVPQIGAHYLQRPSGGRGILLGGSTGVHPGRVVILGAGIVGTGAARVASGLGADVTVLDRDVDRLRQLESLRLRSVRTLVSDSMNIRESVLGADLVVGAVLVVGSRTPALVSRDTVREMRDGAVIVDVDVDHGGCVETSRPTTLDDPVFVEEGVIHYCVKNVPSAVPVTATQALSNALTPYVLRVARRGVIDAVNTDPGFLRGAAIVEGRMVNPTLAGLYGEEHYHLSSVLPLHSEAR